MTSGAQIGSGNGDASLALWPPETKQPSAPSPLLHKLKPLQGCPTMQATCCSRRPSAGTHKSHKLASLRSRLQVGAIAVHGADGATMRDGLGAGRAAVAARRGAAAGAHERRALQAQGGGACSCAVGILAGHARAHVRARAAMPMQTPCPCMTLQRLAAAAEPARAAEVAAAASQQQQFVSDEERRTLSPRQQEFVERKRKAGAGLGPIMPQSCTCTRCQVRCDPGIVAQHRGTSPASCAWPARRRPPRSHQLLPSLLPVPPRCRATAQCSATAAAGAASTRRTRRRSCSPTSGGWWCRWAPQEGWGADARPPRPAWQAGIALTLPAFCAAEQDTLRNCPSPCPAVGAFAAEQRPL